MYSIPFLGSSIIPYLQLYSRAWQKFENNIHKSQNIITMSLDITVHPLAYYVVPPHSQSLLSLSSPSFLVATSFAVIGAALPRLLGGRGRVDILGDKPLLLALPDRVLTKSYESSDSRGLDTSFVGRAVRVVTDADGSALSADGFGVR